MVPLHDAMPMRCELNRIFHTIFLHIRYPIDESAEAIWRHHIQDKTSIRWRYGNLPISIFNHGSHILSTQPHTHGLFSLIWLRQICSSNLIDEINEKHQPFYLNWIHFHLHWESLDRYSPTMRCAQWDLDRISPIAYGNKMNSNLWPKPPTIDWYLFLNYGNWWN